MSGNRERYIKIIIELLTPDWWQIEDIFIFLYISVLNHYNENLLI